MSRRAAIYESIISPPSTDPSTGALKSGVYITPTGPSPKCHLQPGFAIAEYVINEVFTRRFGPYFGLPDSSPWKQLLHGGHSEGKYPL
jgi:hypothetical protein